MKKNEHPYRLSSANATRKEKYIRKIKIYPSFMYSRLDDWLKDMSAKGLHIVHCGLLVFWFEEGEPMKKEYFTYGLTTQEGKYSLSLRYPNLEKTYGVKCKKSKINANKDKAHQIIEIDTDRIDIESDIGYTELKKDRDHLYLKYFIRNAVVFFLVVLLMFIIGFFI